MLCAVQDSPSWNLAPARTVTANEPSSRQMASSARASTMWPSWSVRTGSSMVFHVMNSQLSGCGSKTCTVPTGFPATGACRATCGAVVLMALLSLACDRV